MNIRKIQTIALIFLSVSSLAQAQTTCEQPTDFQSKLEEYSKKEGERISNSSSTLSTKLQEVVDAIKDETASIIQGFQTYTISRAAFQDSVNKIAVIRNRKAANAKLQTTTRTSDFDDKACARATNAPNLLKTRSITTALKEKGIKRYSNDIIKVPPEKITEFNINASHKYFSQSKDSKTANPFKNADINAGSLFGYTTFKNAEDPYGKLPSSDRTPNTQIAAEQYIKNLVDNNGVTTVNKYADSSEQIDQTLIRNGKISRKALAYSFLSQMVSKRSTLPGSATGTGLRGKYSFLANKGETGFSAENAPNIPDDMSEYEYKDYVYSKLYMNPDWILSLGSTKKELQGEELEIVNRNMSLEWDTLLLLEDLATADSVSLAASIDNSK